MRALILGGAGFVGLHLADRLVADGHTVTVVDDFSRGRDDERIGALRAHPEVDIRSADLTSARAWAELPPGYDQIYLLAAVVGVRNVEADPARVIRVNTLTALHLLDWVGPGGRIFFSSTSEVYAGGVDAGIVAVPTAEDVPVMVADVTSPRFAYAISKLLGEAAFVHGAAARAAPPSSAGSTTSTARGWAPTTSSPRWPCGRCAARTRSGSGAPTSTGRSATSTTPSRRCCG